MSEKFWQTKCGLARIYYDHLEEEIIKEAEGGVFRAKRTVSEPSNSTTNSTLATYDQ